MPYPSMSSTTKKYLVLDLETQKSFAQVGGARNKHRLGVSLVGLYHYADDRFVAYREGALEQLSPILQEAELVIGFNLIAFDYPVLAAELGDWVHELPTYDLMVMVQRQLGHRLSLDALAQATLGSGKSGSGLDALHYYAQGDWQSLERYCLQDVKVTRDLYDYVQKEGLLYYQKGSRRVPIPIGEHPLAELFRQAVQQRSSIKIQYNGRERLLDVQHFDGLYIDAFDHSQQATRRFRLDKVEKAQRVGSSTPLF